MNQEEEKEYEDRIMNEISKLWDMLENDGFTIAADLVDVLTGMMTQVVFDNNYVDFCTSDPKGIELVGKAITANDAILSEGKMSIEDALMISTIMTREYFIKMRRMYLEEENIDPEDFS